MLIVVVGHQDILFLCAANQILKLPAGKYTVREREMLVGSAGVPNEFFQSKGFVVSASVLGMLLEIVALLLYCDRSFSHMICSSNPLFETEINGMIFAEMKSPWQ